MLQTRFRLFTVFLALLTAVAVSGDPGQATGAAPRANSVAVHVKGNHLVSANGKATRLLGVDVPGTENACVKSPHVSRVPLTKAEAETIAKWGANAARVTLNEDCWLGVNGLPARYSHEHYQSSIEQWVRDLNSAGMVAVLDLQWSAPGSIPATHRGVMPDETHSVKFWSEVAGQFKSDPGVIFDIFNEPELGKTSPTEADWTCWRNGCTVGNVNVCTAATHVTHVKGACAAESFKTAGMQQLLDTIRRAGARQPVMVGGLHWSGGPCGSHDPGNRGTCLWLKYRPTDPDHQIAVSFHTYNWSQCNRITCWDKTVLPVARDFPVITGELGEKQCSATYVRAYMQWADQHDISYLVWSWQTPTPSLTCAKQGTRLVTSWTGKTNPGTPVAGAVQAHLRAELRKLGRHF